MQTTFEKLSVGVIASSLLSLILAGSVSVGLSLGFPLFFMRGFEPSVFIEFFVGLTKKRLCISICYHVGGFNRS
jgi:hypothetical protein